MRDGTPLCLGKDFESVYASTGVPFNTVDVRVLESCCTLKGRSFGNDGDLPEDRSCKESADCSKLACITCNCTGYDENSSWAEPVKSRHDTPPTSDVPGFERLNRVPFDKGEVPKMSNFVCRTVMR